MAKKVDYKGLAKAQVNEVIKAALTAAGIEFEDNVMGVYPGCKATSLMIHNVAVETENGQKFVSVRLDTTAPAKTDAYLPIED